MSQVYFTASVLACYAVGLLVGWKAWGKCKKEQETGLNVAQNAQERPPFTPKGAGAREDITPSDV